MLDEGDHKNSFEICLSLNRAAELLLEDKEQEISFVGLDENDHNGMELRRSIVRTLEAIGSEDTDPEELVSIKSKDLADIIYFISAMIEV